jgi:uncharacterized protein YcbX
MSNSDWKPIGQIAHITRYPLKGASGEDVENSKVGWHGLTHDRGFALVRVNDLSGLPWVSPRQFPQLLQWSASVPTATSDLRVTTPDGAWLIDPKDAEARADFAAYASKVLGEPMSLMQLWSGTHDSMPVSAISTATMHAAADLVGADMLQRERFRANIVIETDPSRVWPERQWLGRELRVGDGGDSAVLRVDRHTTRCEVVDLLPGCGDDDGLDLFRAIREGNRNRAGVYATPRHVGQVCVGTTVWIR